QILFNGVSRQSQFFGHALNGFALLFERFDGCNRLLIQHESSLCFKAASLSQGGQFLTAVRWSFLHCR
ncbi:hypothetical protein, partial [Neisseria musculi]|uniref:hypothetical protein n=1 Tax=Neisseria musculi TaxID=1815583 RepID=UPI003609AE2F